jgi:glutamine amidotransferase
VAPGVDVGLNFILTDGHTLVGTRWGRTLHTLTREGILPCAICGAPHVHDETERPYRSVEVASEPLTDEPWQEMPDRSIYTVTPEIDLLIEPL